MLQSEKVSGRIERPTVTFPAASHEWKCAARQAFKD
jgi:hypothetical protein